MIIHILHSIGYGMIFYFLGMFAMWTWTHDGDIARWIAGFFAVIFTLFLI